MIFWQQLQSTSGLRAAFLWVLLAFIATAVILFIIRPGERLRIRHAALLLALSVFGLLVSATLLSYGLNPTDSLYRWIRWVSRLLQWLALVNLASVFIFEVLLHALRVRPPRIMRDLLLALAYIVVGMTILSTEEVDVTGIIATSAVITAVIGLSFQDTLGNVMGGMALQLERVIARGDWVRIDGHEGVVKEIRWRHTSIETRNWETIIVPNSVLMKSQVAILGRRTGGPLQHRQWIYFHVGFDYSPTDVIDAVESALRAEPIPNVAREPPANCILLEFKESSSSYAVRYWLTDLNRRNRTNSTVSTRIYFALRRAGIPLSIPAHSLFVTEEDESSRQRRSAQEIDDRAEALKGVELFQGLTDEERHTLAARLRVAPFVRGEAMTRQGAEAHWLYIITHGDAEVRVSVNGRLSERIATLHSGDFFGEMGMMTGERRTATVIALSNVECYRVDKEAFHDIMQSRPEIAEDISEVLARRRAELDAARENLNEEAKRIRMHQHQGDFLHRIRNFFKL